MSLRQTTMMASASSTPEVQYLVPLSNQPSPFWRAVVVTLWVLVPAFGSVMAKDMRFLPEANPGNHSFFKASLQCASMMGAQMEPITKDSMGQPCAAASSTMTL